MSECIGRKSPAERSALYIYFEVIPIYIPGTARFTYYSVIIVINDPENWDKTGTRRGIPEYSPREKMRLMNVDVWGMRLINERWRTGCQHFLLNNKYNSIACVLQHLALIWFYTLTCIRYRNVSENRHCRRTKKWQLYPLRSMSECCSWMRSPCKSCYRIWQGIPHPILYTTPPRYTTRVAIILKP